MIRKMLTLSVLVLFALPCLAAEAVDIEGGWELVKVTGIPAGGASPFGLPNLKLWFSDGRVQAALPELKRDTATPFGTYQAQGETVNFTSPDGTSTIKFRTAPVSDEHLWLRAEDGLQWVLRRLKIAQADVPLEPQSVLVVDSLSLTEPLKDLSVVSSKGDESLPVEKRALGVWELNRVAASPALTPSELPPYGFPTEIIVLTPDGLLYMLEAGKTALKPEAATRFTLKGSTLTGTNEATGTTFTHEIEFNRWGHLVLKMTNVAYEYRRLSAAADKIPVVPGKIVWLERREVK